MHLRDSRSVLWRALCERMTRQVLVSHIDNGQPPLCHRRGCSADSQLGTARQSLICRNNSCVVIAEVLSVSVVFIMSGMGRGAGSGEGLVSEGNGTATERWANDEASQIIKMYFS